MIRHFTCLAIFLLLCTLSFGQEEIEVQAFNYESTTRDTVIEFPTGDHNQYEKILMIYSMRCKDGLVSPAISGQTNIGCGEWDYSCNTYITDSTRVDSFFSTSPNYVISGFSGDVFEYTTQPTYTYYQSTQQQVNYTSTINEVETAYGTGTMPEGVPFNGEATRARFQLLYPAAELSNAGLSAGNLTGLKFDLANASAAYDKLSIRIKSTSASALEASSIDNDGFTEVYFLDTDLAAGENFFAFHTPFNWDGSANLLIDVSYQRPAPETPTSVMGDEQTEVVQLQADASDDQFVELNGAGYIDVPHALSTVQNEITVAFWYRGDDVLPINSTTFEGTDAVGRRQINVHAPWSNGQIYWDCGNDGSGYDRINKAAAANEFKNEWNHMAFTKNATTGQMRIYINGSLWHSGTGKTKPIDVQAFRIGGSMSGTLRNYGGIDDFQVWDKELSQATIQEWMTKPLSNEHPDIDHLVANYEFNNVVGNDITDASPNALNGQSVGPMAFRDYESALLEKNITASNFLPNIVFVQGEYEMDVVEIITLDSLQNIANEVQSYTVNGTDLELVNTEYVYASGEMPIYDSEGNILDYVEVTPEASLTIDQLEHFTKRPSKFEIMSFVTPYGINLDLGIEGKSWVFDVTDFGPILKGNKRITMERGGQWQEDNDIRFVFIEGTPTREVVDIQQVWPVTSESYVRIENNERFEPRTLYHPHGGQIELKAAVTGHGQEGEFIPRQHFINLDGGSSEFEWTVWKECAGNPVYPQGGTWVYDRAGWCPGEATDVQTFSVSEFVGPGDFFDVDYGVIGATGNSNYIVNVQMVTYGGANFSLDAELADIITPSQKVEHERFNPMCGKPKVLIKNNGSTPLTSLDITYSVEGLAPQTYTWNGNLGFLETAEVELPELPITAFASDESTFTASVSNPNGGADQYSNNDLRSTNFDLVPTYGTDVVIRLRTNGAGHETNYWVYDIDGNVLASRTGNLDNFTLYTDTLYGLNGCYRLYVEDSDDDGIEWWANNDGTGSVGIKSLDASYKFLEPDFGGFIQYEFFAGEITPTFEVEAQQFLNVYPNPSRDIFFAELEGYKGEIQINVVNQIGQVLQSKQFDNLSGDILSTTFDLTAYDSGMYYLEIQQEDKIEVRKLVKL